MAVQVGPESMWLRSRIVRPSSGFMRVQRSGTTVLKGSPQYQS